VIVNGKEHPVLPRSSTYQEFAFTFGLTATGSETIEIDTEFGDDDPTGLLVDNFSIVPSVSLSPVPEASTWAMALAGFFALGLANLRAQRRNASARKA
jgi:hypothetical protein